MPKKTINILVILRDEPTGDNGEVEFLLVAENDGDIKVAPLRFEYERADNGFNVRVLSLEGEPAPFITSPVKADDAAEAAETTINELAHRFAIGKVLHENRGESLH